MRQYACAGALVLSERRAGRLLLPAAAAPQHRQCARGGARGGGRGQEVVSLNTKK